MSFQCFYPPQTWSLGGNLPPLQPTTSTCLKLISCVQCAMGAPWPKSGGGTRAKIPSSLVTKCKAVRGELSRVPHWCFKLKALKIGYFSRTHWGKQTIFQLFSEMCGRAQKYVQFPPSDSLTDTLKLTKFLPAVELGGLVPQVPPTRDAPGV